MGKPRLRLHVISHTRWDREGLQAFQELRLNLVQILDDILADLTAHPDRDGFLLDGQSILIEDYLEVRPECRESVARLVANGQLYIGPWYVLPNEFLVSAESIIRNLLLGSETAARLGARLDLGYLPDSVGHIGQIPQILRGFGLESAAIASYTQTEGPLEQWWLAPDGNKLLLVRLCEEQDLRSLSDNAEAFAKILTQIKNKHKKHTEAQTLAILYDSKYQEVPGAITNLIADVQEQIRGTEIIQGKLSNYLAEVREATGNLPTIKGEMLLTQPLAGSFSTRMWVKQHNHAVQMLLEHWAEPFSAWTNLIRPGTSRLRDRRLQKPGELVDYAWHILLPNHASASISGHAIDQVHNEMQIRFEQAEQIGAAIANQSLHYLANQIDTNSIGGDEHQSCAVIFNGAGQPQTGIVTVEIPPHLEQQPIQIVDSSGTLQPIENSHVSEDSPVTPLRYMSFVAQDVPAYGFRTYSLQPAAEAYPATQADNNYAIENEYLSVSVDPSDGTITLFDKQTGRLFAGLNRYVDGGDCGDATAYCPPQKDTLIDIATNMPLYADRYVSSVQQELSYLQIYRLPQMLTPQRDARLPLAAQFVPISIMTTLRLIAGVPRLDIEVQISNGALDHRLRVHFPTGIRTSEVWVDGHSDIISRAVPGDYPQRAFVTALGSDTGLTIANQGLPEIAVQTSAEGIELAITLMRSIGWLQWDEPANGQPVYTPDAQCRGNYRFSYSLIPHAHDPLPAWQQAWAFQTPLKGVITNRHSGMLPLEHSLVKVDNPAFVLSAIKTAATGEGLIVRGYNISSNVEDVVMHLGVKAKKAQVTRIDETPIGPTIKPDSRGRYHFEAKPAEIVTLHFSID